MYISRISVSRRDVWATCPYKYRYQYHLKTPTDVEEPFHFIFGKVVHKIAEEYVAAKGKAPIRDVTELVLDGSIPIEEYNGVASYAPKLLADYKKRIPPILRSLEGITQRIGFEGELEYEFNYDLDPPNKRIISGFIDRLINKDGKWFIIDYKTTKPGKFRKDSSSITTDIQLGCYAKVVQQVFGAKAEDIRAALYYVDDGKLVATTFSQKSLDAVERELLRSYIAIEAADPDQVRGIVGEHCNRCDWRNICPFFRNRNVESKLPKNLL